MKKVECFKCEQCNDIYETEGECKACEESHAGYDNLEVIECLHESQTSNYGYPERIRLVIKDRSGSMCEYLRVSEGSVEDFEPLYKAIDDL